MRSPASCIKSICLVSALSWSSFWLFSRGLSGFFFLPLYRSGAIAVAQDHCRGVLAAGQHCKQSSADPSGQELGALGHVVPLKCQNNSAHHLLLPYLAVLASLTERGTAATASLVPESGLGAESACSLFLGRLFWPFAALCAKGGLPVLASVGVSLVVRWGSAAVACAIWDAWVSLGTAASPQLRRDRALQSLQMPFPWVLLAARGTCQNPLDEVLMVSGACSPCSLPVGMGVGGPSPPWHRTVLVLPHRGLERPRAAPGVPGVRGTLTSAGAKLHGCINRYLSAISHLLPS